MGVIYDPLLGKVRQQDEGGGDTPSAQTYIEEKLILQSSNSIPYAAEKRRKILSVTTYLCKNVLFDGVSLNVGDVIEANNVYAITATMSADNAIIILKTQEV